MQQEVIHIEEKKPEEEEEEEEGEDEDLDLGVTFSVEELLIEKSHQSRICGFALFRKFKKIVILGNDGKTRIWDYSNVEDVGVTKLPECGTRKGGVFLVKYYESENENKFILSSRDGCLSSYKLYRDGSVGKKKLEGRNKEGLKELKGIVVLDYLPPGKNDYYFLILTKLGEFKICRPDSDNEKIVPLVNERNEEHEYVKIVELLTGALLAKSNKYLNSFYIALDDRDISIKLMEIPDPSADNPQIFEKKIFIGHKNNMFSKIYSMAVFEKGGNEHLICGGNGQAVYIYDTSPKERIIRYCITFGLNRIITSLMVVSNKNYNYSCLFVGDRNGGVEGFKIESDFNKVKILKSISKRKRINENGRPVLSLYPINDFREGQGKGKETDFGRWIKFLSYSVDGVDILCQTRINRSFIMENRLYNENNESEWIFIVSALGTMFRDIQRDIKRMFKQRREEFYDFGNLIHKKKSYSQLQRSAKNFLAKYKEFEAKREDTSEILGNIYSVFKGYEEKLENIDCVRGETNEDAKHMFLKFWPENIHIGFGIVDLDENKNKVYIGQISRYPDYNGKNVPCGRGMIFQKESSLLWNYFDSYNIICFGQFEDGMKHGKFEIYSENVKVKHEIYQENFFISRFISFSERNFKVRELRNDFSFQNNEKIGGGGFGEVFEIREKYRDQEGNSYGCCALKLYPGSGVGLKVGLRESNLRKSFELMKRNLSLLHLIPRFEPNIVKVVGFFKPKKNKKDDIRFGYVMERCHFSVSEMLHKEVLIPESTLIEILIQTAKGIKLFHDNEIIHCDLKWENVMVKIFNSDEYWNNLDDLRQAEFCVESIKEKHFSLKIIDFDDLDLREEFRDDLILNTTINVENRVTSVGFTDPYCGGKKAADMFSFGVMIYCLLKRNKNPFDGVDNIFPCCFRKVIKSKKVRDHVAFCKLTVRRMVEYNKEFKNEIDNVLVSLMKKCWNENIKKRPTIDDVLKELEKLEVKVSVKIYLRIDEKLYGEEKCAEIPVGVKDGNDISYFCLESILNSVKRAFSDYFNPDLIFKGVSFDGIIVNGIDNPRVLFSKKLVAWFKKKH